MAWLNVHLLLGSLETGKQEGKDVFFSSISLCRQVWCSTRRHTYHIFPRLRQKKASKQSLQQTTNGNISRKIFTDQPSLPMQHLFLYQRILNKELSTVLYLFNIVHVQPILPIQVRTQLFQVHTEQRDSITTFRTGIT